MSDNSSPNANKNIGANLLPKFFQSDANKKFLASTIDQLVQPGTVKKVTGYIGRKNSKSSTTKDVFVAGTTKARDNYQLEPGLVISDRFDQTTFFKDYQDYINQLTISGSNVRNHERINRQEFYSWDPHINWDMFANFRQYYWLPYGPESIKIYGQQQSINSTFTVTVEESLDNKDYIFSPDGLTRCPNIQLYRGQTYTFEIDSPNEPFSIKVERTAGEFDRYLDNNAVSDFAVESGTVTLRLTDDSPDILYYVSENNIDMGGAFIISDITENTTFDVESEIIGKKHYTLDDGTELSNGMKLCFGGKAMPESYRTGFYFVSGVGSAIKLVPNTVLEVPSTYAEEVAMPFDFSSFEEYPFASASGLAARPDYVVIERSAADQNPWSRYNRWFHADVIVASAAYNGNTVQLDQNRRASRPIIEFEPGLQLFNFGKHALAPIALVDTTSTDIFSTVEGQVGYYIDGVELEDGMRVLFTNETDILAKNKIYQVQILTENYSGDSQLPRYQVHLEPADDPETGDVVLVTSGHSEQSNMFWFNGDKWQRGQTKTEFNQAPLFDVFDTDGYSYGDTSVYRGSTFTGTRLFSYKEATGKDDPVLGFPLTYKNINNIGDIVFGFDLLTDTFTYRKVSNIVTEEVAPGYLLRHLPTEDVYVNGWQKSIVTNYQPAVRIYKNSGKVNNFPLDIFSNISDLLDLEIRVYINSVRINKDQWTLVDSAVYKVLVLSSDIAETDVLTIRAFAAQPINDNGFYEIPISLQNNPLNEPIGTFTLGEVVEHVNSIVDNIQDVFEGELFGANNLHDLANVTPYGTKFVQHSSPFSLPLYHVTSEVNNIIKAIEYSQDNYGRFKRNFITLSDTVGYGDDVVATVDAILEAINKDIPTSAPYYYSDMVGFGPSVKNTFTILDYRTTLYPLTAEFSLATLSTKSVNVYLNDVQLVYGEQYTFNVSGFVEILATLTNGDTLTVYEYESTNGCYIPPTPTKLGAWPKFEPKIFLDDTYVTPCTMIQGHDGSKVLAYGDYRDELILELEKRIYNNIKVEYNPDIFDIHDVVPGYCRSNDYSLSEFNTVLAPSFYKWTKLVDRDFSKPISFDSTNPFTYNYRGHEAPDGREVPGYWKGIYRWLLDTDRPHTAPWEMLGFPAKPVWWNEVYGPAPYTSNNTILWDDIATGTIREPNRAPRVNPKYVRPYIVGHLPVDVDGNLISPMDSNLATGLITPSTGTGYIFGDISPVENAWRNSSYYPFAVLQTAALLKPSFVLGTLFDRSRVIRNATGQLVYSETNLRIRPADILIPSLRGNASVVLTCGLVNYIVDFACAKNQLAYSNYATDLASATVKLSYRVAGFTSKEKFSLLLDSKNPASTGGVFVPPEDYTISLNSSTPVKKITYSGVIITKLTDGYEVKGYSQSQPFFKYYSWVQSGPTVNVGGISESYSIWTPGKLYITGQNVVYENRYYKATKNNQGSTFDNDAFIKLLSLPVTGGREAEFRKVWDKSEDLMLPYGTKFETVQEVVDFLLGHGEYLKEQGLIFDDFNSTLGSVTNWETSAKEFMFWTTQNWSSGNEKWAEWIPETDVGFGSIVKYNGDYWKALRNIPASTDFEDQYYDKLDGLSVVGSSVISLSPSANRLMFKITNSIVDDISNSFNDYEIFKVDGTPITPDQLESFRDEGIVTYTPRTTDGIFCATFYLIQKEQVVIINNSTMFNDTIYNTATGYRQERIKISGYISTAWDGSFNAPGFIFDKAHISEWTPWTDYSLGDIVLYKTKYYTSLEIQLGTEFFDDTKWSKLDTVPQPQLLPNWTYKAGQFTDFYSLDSDNFDDTQQVLAQHLIGYQKRDYLANIIQNDVSEYKFYQGMIVEKGTQNSLNKLFDVLSATGSESLKFYEEWALRTGRYGASEAFETFELVLDESLIKSNPQGYQLVESESVAVDFIIRPTPADILVKPAGYDSTPWPLNENFKSYLRTPGYVRTSEVSKVVSTLDDLIGTPTTGFKNGDYIWAGFETPTWDIYRYTASKWTITEVTYDADAKELTITTDALIDPALEGTYVGITNVSFNNFYKVKTVSLSKIILDATIPGWINPFTGQAAMLVFLLTTQRSSSIDTAGDVLPKVVKADELLWTDDAGTGKWGTWQYNTVYSNTEIAAPTITQDLGFGKSIVTNREATKAAIYTANGIVIYRKVSSTWTVIQTLTASFSTTGNDPTIFGETLAFSTIGDWLFVGSPRAVSTYNYEGEIAVYRLDNAGTYSFVNYLNADTPLVGKQFSSSMVAKTDTLIIGARGANNKRGSVEIFKLVNNLWVYDSTLIENVVAGADYGTNVRASDDLSILAISAPGSDPGQVFVYKLTNGVYTLSQTITGNEINYGIGLSVTPSGSFIAVGAMWYNGTKVDQGKVEVYQLDNSQYSLYQTLYSPTPATSENFGRRVGFMNNGETLVVYSENGTSFEITTIDSSNTTFDSNVLRLIDSATDGGRIDIFDKYATKWVYSESLATANQVGSNYGRGLGIGNNTILVGDPQYTNGSVTGAGIVYRYEKSAGDLSWKVIHSEADKPNLDRIKAVFLYDKAKNTLVTYLDIVDPIQGKIAGAAEEELRYKTFYDPAIYSVGDSTVSVDEGMAWTTSPVGQLWWDLRTAKFIDNYDDNEVYRNSVLNTLYPTASIDVYEWVESSLLPSSWDILADTEEGLVSGISGTSLYGDTAYSIKRKYDTVTESFKNTYYFWVKNKQIVPNFVNRNLSAASVASLIRNPRGQGYQYITLTGTDSFSLVNVAPSLNNTDVVLAVEYWLTDKVDQNIHHQWKIISNDPSSSIPLHIEKKWIDSLCGKDILGRIVPDEDLPTRLKYGIESTPRQSMFVNKQEAAKELIEQVNRVLIQHQVVLEKNISGLEEYEAEPTASTGLYDLVIDTGAELRFVNIVMDTAELSPVIVEGSIVGVTINNAGAGYVNPPFIKIEGSGAGAVLRTTIDAQGRVTGATVISKGKGYKDDTVLTVRPVSVLIHSDEDSDGVWAIYKYELGVWSRESLQSFDIRRYWSYTDWYATGVDQATTVNYVVDTVNDLYSISPAIGAIVKIRTTGLGGWQWLRKYAESSSIDWTRSYEVIATQNGTLQFKTSLYKFINSEIGYDGTLYDVVQYDNIPTLELRKILATLKADILIDDLKEEYLNLFFVTLKYAISEQHYLDWAFKTSFVKAQHLAGTLRQTTVYKNDNLADFEKYVEEVKPYRTKVREYISNYSTVDANSMMFTDFDLPPVHNGGQTDVIKTYIVDGEVQTTDPSILLSPWNNWYENVGFKVVEIVLIDGGSGYYEAPTVTVESDSGTGVIARAFITNGSVVRIVLLSQGSGYFSAPTITFSGEQTEDGTPAKAVAIIGDSLVRSNLIKMKFDRISRTYSYTQLNKQETFTGTGAKRTFSLVWPADIKTGRVSVDIDGVTALRDTYAVTTTSSTAKGYTTYNSIVTFVNPPAGDTEIVVNYLLDISLLSAADRVQYFYNPESGQFGNDLAQVMTGVDYGGVTVTGLNFGQRTGWGGEGYYTDRWDTFDETFDDFYVTTSENVHDYTLPYIPADGTEINVYYAGVNHDVYDADGTTTDYIVSEKFRNYSVTYSTTSALVTGGAVGSLIITVASTTNISVGDKVECTLNPTAFQPNTIVTAINGSAVTINRNTVGIIASGTDITFINTLEEETDYTVVGTGTGNVVVRIEPPVPAGTLLQISYVTEPVRIDDPDFDTNPANPNALMATIIADGESDVVTLPGSITINDGDQLVFRKSTSDGSMAPNESDYDTALTGGDMAYETALGINPEDIIVDGDDFITPTSSPAPEEVVPGQIVDTLAIKFYGSATSQSARVKIDTYIATGTTSEFGISQTINSKQAIIVSVNNQILTETTDYIVDLQLNIVNFTSIPAAGDVVALYNFGLGGENILDYGTITITDPLDEFVTNSKWYDDFVAVVYKNGDVVEPDFFATDETYAAPDRIGMRFDPVPETGSVITYIIVRGTEKTFTTATKEIVTTNGTDYTYDLSNIIGTNKPYDSYAIVRVGNTILRPSSNIYVTINNNTHTYFVPEDMFAPFSVNASEIKLYVGDTELVQSTDYTFNVSGISVTLSNGAYNLHEGKQLTISITKNAEYSCTEDTITFVELYPADTDIEVMSCYNHNVLSTNTSDLTVAVTGSLTPETVEYFNFTGLTGGKVSLPKYIVDEDSVWVTRNGVLQTPSFDYKLNDDRVSITFNTALDLNDTIGLVIYASAVGAQPRIAFMQFKDMLNRVHYKRLNANKLTTLVSNLLSTDLEIEVADGSVLSDPIPTRNIPGVIYVAGERIEYFSKTGNTLGSLRRGTLGTGAPAIHAAGNWVQDIGAAETIPYHEAPIITQVKVDGTSNYVDLPYVPAKTDDVWEYATGFESNIPNGYGQSNEIEVFVGGYDDENPWMPGKDYIVGDFVTIGMYVYKCINKHTSGSTFESDNWTFFIGNIRLKKIPFSVYNANLHLTSAEGDAQFDAEFSVDGSSSQVRLTNSLAANTQVTVIKRTSGYFPTSDEDLYYNNNAISKFLNAAPGTPFTNIVKYDSGEMITFDSDRVTFDSTQVTFDRR